MSTQIKQLVGLVIVIGVLVGGFLFLRPNSNATFIDCLNSNLNPIWKVIDSAERDASIKFVLWVDTNKENLPANIDDIVVGNWRTLGSCAIKHNLSDFALLFVVDQNEELSNQGKYRMVLGILVQKEQFESFANLASEEGISALIRNNSPSWYAYGYYLYETGKLR